MSKSERLENIASQWFLLKREGRLILTHKMGLVQDILKVFGNKDATEAYLRHALSLPGDEAAALLGDVPPPAKPIQETAPKTAEVVTPEMAQLRRELEEARQRNEAIKEQETTKRERLITALEAQDDYYFNLLAIVVRHGGVMGELTSQDQQALDRAMKKIPSGTFHIPNGDRESVYGAFVEAATTPRKNGPSAYEAVMGGVFDKKLGIG